MKETTVPNLSVSPFLFMAALAFTACGGEQEPGVLEVAIYGEEYIEEGIPADAAEADVLEQAREVAVDGARFGRVAPTGLP